MNDLYIYVLMHCFSSVFYSINDIGAADLQPIEESILMMSVRKRAVNGGGSHSSLFDRVTG